MQTRDGAETGLLEGAMLGGVGVVRVLELEQPRTAGRDVCPLVQNAGAGAGAEKQLWR